MTPRSCALSFQHEPAPDWPWRYRGPADDRGCGRCASPDARRREPGVDVHALRSRLPSLPAGGGRRAHAVRGGAVSGTETQARFRGNASTFPRRSVFATGRASPIGRAPITASTAGQAARRCATRAPARSVSLEGCEATRFLIVYIPAGADYFCLEPVTHAVNAMNLPDAAAERPVDARAASDPRNLHDHPLQIKGTLTFKGDGHLLRGASGKGDVPLVRPLYLTRLAAATSAYQRPESLTVRRCWSAKSTCTMPKRCE